MDAPGTLPREPERQRATVAADRGGQQPDSAAVADAPPPAERRRITFESLLRDGVAAALGVNSRWLRTLRALVVNAGGMARDYVAGARERYSHPMAYALASVTAYAVIRQFLERDSFFAGLDPVIRLGAAAPYVAIPLLIPTALVLNALFRRQRLGAAESYVMVLYASAQIALMETGLTLALYAGAPGWIAWGVRAVEALYGVAAVVQFTGERRWHGWLRAALVAATAVASVYGPMLLVAWYSWGFLR
ncbi:MAG TPA: DUF3667 domain-containing protein [Longimicrobiales bacterium]|nr:DUF3667 domain-containing protein [Longimicrobiales bacterium]